MTLPDDATLKQLEEQSNKLLENLTGGQIQTVLDYLILQALSPIIHNSKVFDAQIIYLLALVTKNRKRKISALPREEFISILCQYLATDDPYKKIFLLETAKIERGFICNFVVNVLKRLDGFLPIYQKNLLTTDKAESLRLTKKLDVISKELGMTNDSVFCVYTQSTDYLELAYKFRNFIVSNYVRYAYKQAKAYCSSRSNSFDFQDVWHNFLAAITKAIDKYDSSKGALTSYIAWWLLNVQTATSNDHGHEYGLAYTIPQIQRKKLAQKDNSKVANFSISLDTLVTKEGSEITLSNYVTSEIGLEENLEKDEELEIIKYLIKKADYKEGLARLYLDLSEYFSKKELRWMKQSMKRQGTYSSEFTMNLI
jgi:hypothetical protein